MNRKNLSDYQASITVTLGLQWQRKLIARLHLVLEHGVFLFFLLLCISCITENSYAQSLSLRTAIVITLSNNQNIALSALDTKIAAALFTQTAGEFDSHLLASTTYEDQEQPLTEFEQIYGSKIDSLDRENRTFQLGLEKKFHNGMIISPSLTMSRLETNIKELLAIQPENRASLGFSLYIPLLKNSYPGATEKSAEFSWQQQKYANKHTVTLQILQTMQRYWEAVGAKKRLELLMVAEKNASTFVQQIEKLVQGKERPASNRDLALADAASKEAERILAEQQFTSARYELARTLGIEQPCIKELLDPITVFPIVDDERVKDYLQEEVLLADIENRNDLLALKKEITAKQWLVEQAHINKNHSLDFNLSVEQNGLTENRKTFSAANNLDFGPSVTASLTYQWPIENRVATGNLEKLLAELGKTEVQYDSLQKSAEINFRIAREALQNAALRLKKSNISEQYYRKALKNEEKKLRLGSTTLLDLIRLKDQLLDQAIAKTNSAQAYATAIPRLLFEANHLLKEEAGELQVNFDWLAMEQ